METSADEQRGGRFGIRAGGKAAEGLLACRAATAHHLFRRDWDTVARSHGLELFVDHIHLSDRGAAMVTELVAGWLRR